MNGTKTLLAVGLLAISSACAKSPGADQPAGGVSAGAVASGGGPPINWNSPLQDGVTVQGAAAATTDVPFKVVDPRVGNPSLIQVDDPAQVAAASRTVAFVYNLPGDGIVNVEESTAATGMGANLVARANAYAADPTPDPAAASFQMVALGDGQALLVSQGGRGAELWVQGGVLFEITGQTLTSDQAQELAAVVYKTAA